MSGLIHYGNGDTAGNRTPVTQATPLPVLDGGGAPYRGAVALTVGAAQAAQRGLAVLCTVASNVCVSFADGSSLTFPVGVGLTVLPFEITTVNAAGATATATFYNLV